MKICVLAFSHQWSDERIYTRQVRSLLENGHQVRLIARRGNTATSKSPAGNGPQPPEIGGSALPRAGDGRWALTCFAARPRSTLPRLLQDPWMFLRYFLAAFAARADLIVCHEPQSMLIGMLLKRTQRTLLVYDVHEYQPESYADRLGARLYPHAVRFFRRLERLLVRRAQAVFTVNDDLAGRLRADCDVVVVLPNYPRLDFAQNAGEVPVELRERYAGLHLLVYSGGLTAARGIHACLDVLRQLLRRDPTVRLVLIGALWGKHAAAIQQRIADLELGEFVTLTGRLARNELLAYLQLADLGLFLAQPAVERFHWGEPVKYFEYAAVGLPVALSDLPAKRRLIETYANGILVDPLDEISAARAIDQLLQSADTRRTMAENGRRAHRTRLNWEAVEPEMMAALALLAAQRAGRNSIN